MTTAEEKLLECKNWRAVTSADAAAVCEGQMWELLRDVEGIADFFYNLANAENIVEQIELEGLFGAAPTNPNFVPALASPGPAVGRAIARITLAKAPQDFGWLRILVGPDTEDGAPIVVPFESRFYLHAAPMLATATKVLQSISRKLKEKLDTKDCCTRVRRHEFGQESLRVRGKKHGQFRSGGVTPFGSTPPTGMVP